MKPKILTERDEDGWPAEVRFSSEEMETFADELIKFLNWSTNIASGSPSREVVRPVEGE